MNRFTLALFVVAIAVCAQSSWWTIPNASSYGYLGQQSFLVVEAPPIATTTLTIVGDIMLARNVETLMNLHGKTYPFSNSDLSETNGYVLGNFEASVPEIHQQTPNFTYAFSVATSALPALRNAGFTHVSLANNHSYDFGEPAYRNTKHALADADIISFGDQFESATTSLAYFDLGSKTVAVLALYAVNRVPDLTVIDELLASNNTDYTVAYVHWGTEYQEEADKAQIKLAQQLTENGFDLIIGHHPHVVGSIDLVNGVPVIYSLGNYIFDQYFSDEVMTGLTVAITPNDDGLTVSLQPVSSIETLSSPKPLTAEAKDEFLADLAKISSHELKTAIIKGELEI